MISALHLLALSQIPDIGSRRLRALVTHFGDTAAAIGASAKEIARVDGFGVRLASAVARFKRDRGMKSAWIYAERQLSRLNRAEGTIISFWDEAYPPSLKSIYDPPPFLFACGSSSDRDRHAIAIVGTRRPSEYGVSVAAEFSAELSRRGITIVSGLARGIDTVAHENALKSGGRTVAAVGSGLDVVYPPENRALFRRIAGQGLIISEFSMGSKPDAQNFPRRNRIISGMALGTVVIETDRNGGAMITANLALDQNREVFAVPGSIRSKHSRGCNTLIREGRAKLVENIDDILIELADLIPRGWAPASRAETHRAAPEMTLFEHRVYDVLSTEPIHIDDIAAASGLQIPDVLVHLLALEFKGLITQRAGKMFLLA